MDLWRDPGLNEIISNLDLGDLIRHARESSEDSQFWFAYFAGIQQSQLSRYENGSRLPTIRTLIRIAAQARLTLKIQLGTKSFEFDGDYYQDKRALVRRMQQLEQRQERRVGERARRGNE